MKPTTQQMYTAFEGSDLLAAGTLEEVVLKVKKRTAKAPESSILVFNDLTGKTMDFDLRGSDKEVLHRLRVFVSDEVPTPHQPAGPGRPKLGVIAREVSLLPRHWEWLATQSGGASATLRRLVEDARKQLSPRDLIRQSQESAYRFMSTLAGDLPNYEEALRALYAKDEKKFKELTGKWPRDIATHARKLARPTFE